MGTFIPLGKDVLGLILRELDVEDILAFGLTGKFVHGETKRPHLWAFLVARDFDVEFTGDALQVYKEEYRFARDHPSQHGHDDHCALKHIGHGDSGSIACFVRRGIGLSKDAAWSVFNHAKYRNKCLLALLPYSQGICPNRLLIACANTGDTSMVKALIEDFAADPSAENNAALLQAFLGGHAECAKLLLCDERVSPTPLLLVKLAQHGQTSSVCFLLRGYLFEEQDIRRAEKGAQDLRHKKTAREIRKFYYYQRRLREKK